MENPQFRQHTIAGSTSMLFVCSFAMVLSVFGAALTIAGCLKVDIRECEFLS
jgi:hypothetical protein